MHICMEFSFSCLQTQRNKCKINTWIEHLTCFSCIRLDTPVGNSFHSPTDGLIRLLCLENSCFVMKLLLLPQWCAEAKRELIKASSGYEQQQKGPHLGGKCGDASPACARAARPSISSEALTRRASLHKPGSATQHYSHPGLITASQVSPQASCSRKPPLASRFNKKHALASQHFNYSSAWGIRNSSSILKIILAPITAPILHHLLAKRRHNHGNTRLV